MKKLLLLTTCVGFILTGCGIENLTKTPSVEEFADHNRENVTIKKSNHADEAILDEMVEVPIGGVIETEAGRFTLVRKTEVNEWFYSGPLKVTIPKVKVVHAFPENELQTKMNSDEFSYVTVALDIENLSDEEIAWFPEQASLILNTGEEVEVADLFLSDNLGGTLIEGMIKTGSLVFVIDRGDAADIEWIRLRINGPLDQNDIQVGANLDIRIDLYSL
ncbi:DUF4352 domain-containing protein [Anaerobacillus sp. CMMVII]|uniref:DUF4352 domain-containing protein n=1 Tax=Anaerobacillus sp. CMMVII TaxID=2755588 RepID=UPI0021B7D909|nr:DUF4352 domain-containing protein [Anaerobacillus sp. CMMVII]MCT8139208.1 DUF4352 domain-containing protein [Anaerobacillus sp. CMMVII]